VACGVGGERVVGDGGELGERRGAAGAGAAAAAAEERAGEAGADEDDEDDAEVEARERKRHARRHGGAHRGGLRPSAPPPQVPSPVGWWWAVRLCRCDAHSPPRLDNSLLPLRSLGPSRFPVASLLLLLRCLAFALRAPSRAWRAGHVPVAADDSETEMLGAGWMPVPAPAPTDGMQCRVAFQGAFSSVRR